MPEPSDLRLFGSADWVSRCGDLLLPLPAAASGELELLPLPSVASGALVLLPLPAVASGDLPLLPLLSVASRDLLLLPLPAVASGELELLPLPAAASGDLVLLPLPAAASGELELLPLPCVASGDLLLLLPLPAVASGDLPLLLLLSVASLDLPLPLSASSSRELVLIAAWLSLRFSPFAACVGVFLPVLPLPLFAAFVDAAPASTSAMRTSAKRPLSSLRAGVGEGLDWLPFTLAGGLPPLPFGCLSGFHLCLRGFHLCSCLILSLCGFHLSLWGFHLSLASVQLFLWGIDLSLVGLRLFLWGFHRFPSGMWGCCLWKRGWLWPRPGLLLHRCLSPLLACTSNSPCRIRLVRHPGPVFGQGWALRKPKARHLGLGKPGWSEQKRAPQGRFWWI